MTIEDQYKALAWLQKATISVVSVERMGICTTAGEMITLKHHVVMFQKNHQKNIVGADWTLVRFYVQFAVLHKARANCHEYLFTFSPLIKTKETITKTYLAIHHKSFGHQTHMPPELYMFLPVIASLKKCPHVFLGGLTTSCAKIIAGTKQKTIAATRTIHVSLGIGLLVLFRENVFLNSLVLEATSNW
ncbi:hypothetical protein ACJX0J_023832 [Zea mays]